MCVVIDHPLQPFSRSDFRQDIELWAILQSSARPVVRPIVDLIFPAPLVASGLPESGELRTAHTCVGKPYLPVVEPMVALPHRQQELTMPWEPDAFRPTS
jgi:hypothetical protein